MGSIFDEESEFDNYGTGSANAELEKAINAGYGTDAAQFEGGRSLQREDLEATLVTILDVNQNDCKVFHKLHKEPVSSTVHQFETQTGVGDEDFLFVEEGEEATEDDPDFKRKFLETKYQSTKWQVSHPATLTNNVANPINKQKVSAVLRITKSTEKAIFHGDSSVVPKQYDGMLKIIRDSAKDTDVSEKLRATRVDLRGFEIGETGSDDIYGTIAADEELFNSIAEQVFNKGGDLSDVYFPPVIAGQFWKLFSDRLRYTTGDTHLGLAALPDIPTAIGSTLKIKGDCGADKMFRVKGEIAASGDSSKRPNTPTSITAATASDSASKFTTSFAGNYVYSVHAVNAYGISAAVTTSTVAVASGQKVTLTITPDSNGKTATGFIICRTNAGGSKLMEMVRIKKGAGATTTYVDLNEDLPGTASVVLLTPKTSEMEPNMSFAQLMGISNFDLPTNSSLAHRGVVALYGALEMRAPSFNAIIDNVGYKGGLY